jgi:hypothetical protein
MCLIRQPYKDVLVVLDAGYDAPRIAHLLAGLPGVCAIAAPVPPTDLVQHL